MNIYNRTTNYIDNIPKRYTDAKKTSLIKDFILNIECIDKYGNKSPCKDTTKSVLITKIKYYIKNNNIFKDTKNIDNLNAPEIYNKIFQKVNIDRTNKKPIDVDIDTISKIMNLKCDKIMNNKGEYEHNIYSLYSYLLATSGMRTNEIWDNSFDIVDYNTIKPKRISKKEYDDNAVVKLLISSTEWINYFNVLHMLIEKRDIKYGSTIFSGIKRKLQTINPNISGHTLRKIYLSYHKQILNTEPDKLPSVRTKQLLNHSSENASAFYNDAVNITGELKDVIDRTDYSKYTIAKLKDVLTSKNISYTSKMKKTELIKLLTC